jgi:OOP family OmpA-OmpF porin
VCEISAENNVYFEQVKQYLAATSGKKVLVTGHSDSIGPEAAKEKVSAQRAGFVRQKLAEAGIPSEAIVIISESDRKPVSDNSTDEGRAKNRRAEIIIQ